MPKWQKKGDRKQALLATINHAGPHEDVQPKFAELLGQTGARCYIEPPFFCDFGDHISLGDDVYINTNAVFLDSGQITIGDRVLIGPRVNLFAASHPIAADVRTKWLALGHPIVIGNNVWLGGGVTVNPGVTIGENTIIGSGAVVTMMCRPTWSPPATHAESFGQSLKRTKTIGTSRNKTTLRKWARLIRIMAHRRTKMAR